MRTRLEEAKAAAEISSKITEAETGTSKIRAGILTRMGFRHLYNTVYFYVLKVFLKKIKFFLYFKLIFL
jgi:hypothetical protein